MNDALESSSHLSESDSDTADSTETASTSPQPTPTSPATPGTLSPSASWTSERSDVPTPTPDPGTPSEPPTPPQPDTTPMAASPPTSPSDPTSPSEARSSSAPTSPQPTRRRMRANQELIVQTLEEDEHFAGHPEWAMMRQIVRQKLLNFKISPAEFLEIRNMTITTMDIGNAPRVSVTKRKKSKSNERDVGEPSTNKDSISEMRVFKAEFLTDYRDGLHRMKSKAMAEVAKSPPLKSKSKSDLNDTLPQPSVQKQGWLLKKPVNRDAKLAFGTSKRRFFYLTPRALVYFKSSKMQRRKGSVDINATTQTSIKGAKSFQIKGEGVNFVAAADNQAARDDWVKKIDAAILAQKEEKAQKISRQQAQKRSSEELLLLRILQARGLAAKGRGNTSSPYCIAKITHTKVYEGEKFEKYEGSEDKLEEEYQASYCATTQVINNSTSPVWNSQMEITLSRDEFPCVVMVEVFSKNSLGKDRFLGRTILCLNNINRGNVRAKWFTLGKRSAKSHVSGQVQLQMYTSYGTSDASTGTTTERQETTKIGLEQHEAEYSKFFTNVRSHPRLRVMVSNPFRSDSEEAVEMSTNTRLIMRASSYTPVVMANSLKSPTNDEELPARVISAVNPHAPPVLNLPPSSRRWPNGERPLLWNSDIMLLCPTSTGQWYKVPGQLMLSEWRVAFLMDDKKSAVHGKRHIPENWRAVQVMLPGGLIGPPRLLHQSQLSGSVIDITSNAPVKLSRDSIGHILGKSQECATPATATRIQKLKSTGDVKMDFQTSDQDKNPKSKSGWSGERSRNDSMHVLVDTSMALELKCRDFRRILLMSYTQEGQNALAAMCKIIKQMRLDVDVHIEKIQCRLASNTLVKREISQAGLKRRLAMVHKHRVTFSVKSRKKYNSVRLFAGMSHKFEMFGKMPAAFGLVDADCPLDIMEEFERIKVPSKAWRITTINIDFSFAPSYPPLIVVPRRVEDKTLMEVGKHCRSRARIPALTWLHPITGGAILRSSQPSIKFNQADSELLEAARRCNEVGDPKHQLDFIIVDARPKINALANKAKMKGFEDTSKYNKTEIYFMDIGNIHVMRKALLELWKCCEPLNRWQHAPGTASSDSNYGVPSVAEPAVAAWLGHIRLVLAAAAQTCNYITQGQSVLVHCSDGWDRTPQLSALSSLLMDPYYRTYKGFQVLVAKEWLSFGHKFRERCAHSSKLKEESPVFIQFLETVWQCMSQFPTAFEFNDKLLISLCDHSHSGWFGTFLGNNSKEREDRACGTPNTFSIWGHLKESKALFMNPNYKAIPEQFVLKPCLKSLVLWQAYYCRYHPVINTARETMKHPQLEVDIVSNAVLERVPLPEGSRGSSESIQVTVLRLGEITPQDVQAVYQPDGNATRVTFPNGTKQTWPMSQLQDSVARAGALAHLKSAIQNHSWNSGNVGQLEHMLNHAVKLEIPSSSTVLQKARSILASLDK